MNETLLFNILLVVTSPVGIWLGIIIIIATVKFFRKRLKTKG